MAATSTPSAHQLAPANSRTALNGKTAAMHAACYVLQLLLPIPTTPHDVTPAVPLPCRCGPRPTPTTVRSSYPAAPPYNGCTRVLQTPLHYVAYPLLPRCGRVKLVPQLPQNLCATSVRLLGNSHALGLPLAAMKLSDDAK